MPLNKFLSLYVLPPKSCECHCINLVWADSDFRPGQAVHSQSHAGPLRGLDCSGEPEFFIFVVTLHTSCMSQAAAERQTSLESDLTSSQRFCAELQSRLSEVAQQFDVEHSEWEQLQKDLQVAVVVANDFRTEAQNSFDTVLAENESLRDRITTLTIELTAARHHLAASGKCPSL